MRNCTAIMKQTATEYNQEVKLPSESFYWTQLFGQPATTAISSRLIFVNFTIEACISYTDSSTSWPMWLASHFNSPADRYEQSLAALSTHTWIKVHKPKRPTAWNTYMLFMLNSISFPSAKMVLTPAEVTSHTIFSLSIRHIVMDGNSFWVVLLTSVALLAALE